MQVYYFILYFFIYGFFGWCTEVAYAGVKQGRFVNRGFLNGPICPIYGVGVGVVVQFLAPFEHQLLLLYAASTVLVTLIEWVTGFLMDKIFRHKWWDYSNQPLNIGGYVCLLFSLVWGVACVVIVKVIHPLIHQVLTLIPVTIAIILIVILGIVLSADIYVTASGILKLNRRLEAMDKIAAELRGLSDKVGENIYESVAEGMEKQEEGRKKLRDKYLELQEQGSRVSSRLMKAFPKMESRNHKDILEELKNIARKGRR